MSQAIQPRLYRRRNPGNVRVDIEVEAMQWDGSFESQSQIVTWSNGGVSGWFDGAYYLDIEGERAGVGDWVVKLAGRFHVHKPAAFEETYEDAARTE